MTKSIFFLFILVFVAACKPGKTGLYLGGLTDTQFKEFDDMRSNWADARSAYRGFASISSASARAVRMAGLLKNSQQCEAFSTGGEDLNLGGSSDAIEHGTKGEQCAVAADETMNYQRSATVAAFGLGHTYHVSKTSFGTQYQREDPIRDVGIGGSFSVYKQANGFRIGGSFTFTAANKNDPREDTTKGYVDVSNGKVVMTIHFPTWDLNASATWNAYSPGAPVTYVVGGSQVTSSEFNSAFEHFRIPEIVRYAQTIPNHL